VTGNRAADHQALLETVDGGAQLPGYQGPALRRGPHRRPPAALLLLNAFAVVLLTLLGAAGVGMISSPTPSRPIPCSAKAACSTT
jgi:hypothetical protein